MSGALLGSAQILGTAQILRTPAVLVSGAPWPSQDPLGILQGVSREVGSKIESKIDS